MNSMTGFGKAEAADSDRKICIEMKSVNHRYLDISIRAPHFLGQFEAEIRRAVKEHISRGRVEITVLYASRAPETGTLVNLSLVGGYLEAVSQICSAYGVPNDITVSQLVSLPDVVTAQPAEADAEMIRALISAAAHGALRELMQARAAEGAELAADMLPRLALLRCAADEIAAREEDVVCAYRSRLTQRIADLTADLSVEPQRIEQEVALFADRCNVTEEVVRVRSHIEQFAQMAAAEGPVGKNLDFLLQELNREFNTIGSKAQDAQVTDRVIAAKAELEKIREQIQNIE